MSICRLELHNVRNIQAQTLYPSATLNFIYGKNASGKSALIEAIYLLGRAKSFRTSSIKSVIRFEQAHLIVSAQLHKPGESVIQIGIQMDGKDVTIHVNQQNKSSRSDLAYALPLQIIHPKSFELLDAGAQLRREFMDWGIFNDDPKFLPAWRKYKKALLQRNAVLKAKAIDQLDVWNSELVKYGTIVTKYREQYINKLIPLLTETVEHFLGKTDVDLRLESGWDISQPLLDNLIESLDRDLRDGFTHYGAHRDDFQLLINNKFAKDVVSRGQLKLLVICLKLAQVDLIFREKGIASCILVDDFAAELDSTVREKLLVFFKNLKCQVFITGTEKHEFGNLEKFENNKMFHVEQGEIKPEDVPCGT